VCVCVCVCVNSYFAYWCLFVVHVRACVPGASKGSPVCVFSFLSEYKRFIMPRIKIAITTKRL